MVKLTVVFASLGSCSSQASFANSVLQVQKASKSKVNNLSSEPNIMLDGVLACLNQEAKDTMLGQVYAKAHAQDYEHGLMLLLNAADLELETQAIFLFSPAQSNMSSGALKGADSLLVNESQALESTISGLAKAKSSGKKCWQEPECYGWSESLFKKLSQLDLYDVPCIACVLPQAKVKALAKQRLAEPCQTLEGRSKAQGRSGSGAMECALASVVLERLPFVRRVELGELEALMCSDITKGQVLWV